jgi:acetylornithine deacetylase
LNDGSGERKLLITNSELEKLDKLISDEKDSIVTLLQKLVQFNTTVTSYDSKPIQELECQSFIADLLKGLGAQVDMWEPDPSSLRKYPNFLSNRTFRNRPIVVGRLGGCGGGRSLLLNFHIDVVEAKGEEDGWTYDPFSGIVSNHRVYGRGTSDMKGGAASILKALEFIKKSGIRLKGDVVVESVTDEEINGMGTIACIERGYTIADAAIFCEPTELNVYAAMRGDLIGKVIVEGRQGWPFGNPGGTIPHWISGGPVNAIEKAILIIKALKALEYEWRYRPDKEHDFFPSPTINITAINGGTWNFIPSKCELIFTTGYPPSNKDSQGFGSLVKKEIEDYIFRAACADNWLRSHPPKIEWIGDYPGADLALNHPITKIVKEAATDLGLQSKVTGLDTADDASILMNMTGIPSIEFGPGSNSQAHAVDEFVSIDELVNSTRVLAAAICRWCGYEKRV